jgi:hypothetical protein
MKRACFFSHSFLSFEGAAQHLVVAQIKDLRDMLGGNAAGDKDAIHKCLCGLQETLSTDLATRCLAAKEGALDTLLQVVTRFRAEETAREPIFEQSLRTLASLLEGQPDIIYDGEIVISDTILAQPHDSKTVDILCETLKEHSAKGPVQAAGIRAIRYCCVMHETNRLSFVRAGLMDLLLSCVEFHTDYAPAVAEAAHCLRVLTIDDDIRVPFGKVSFSSKRGNIYAQR